MSFLAARSLSAFWLVSMVAACSGNEFSVSDAWIPAAPPHVSALAGYMIMENDTDDIKTLVGITGQLFERIEVHRTVFEADSGLARMLLQEQVTVDPGERLVFEPGGYHLMLIGPSRSLVEGEEVALRLRFADGIENSVVFEVRPRKALRP